MASSAAPAGTGRSGSFGPLVSGRPCPCLWSCAVTHGTGSARTRATHTQKRASETARTLTNSIAIRAAAGPRDPASLRRSAITKRPLSHGSVCSVDLFEFINRSYVTTKVHDSASEGCGLAAMHGGQVAAPQPGRAHPPVGVTARKKVGSGF